MDSARNGVGRRAERRVERERREQQRAAPRARVAGAARSKRVRIDPTRVERPLAANVPSNTPIVLRTSGQTEQSKTLKCSECGALNYPTEWYCERCGAELAAL